jgi:hypothetical protein
MKPSSGQLIAEAVKAERDRIIQLLINLNAIRRDALGDLVAMDTYGEKCIYLPGLEIEQE